MTDLTWTWPGSPVLTERAGECYTLAMEAVVANIGRYGDRLFLVHGVLHPDESRPFRDRPREERPPLNPHAWVEVVADDGVMALDPVLRMAWPVESHRDEFGAEVIRRYRADIAVAIAARRGDLGPWDRRSLAEWDRRQQAQRDDPRWSMQAAVDKYLR